MKKSNEDLNDFFINFWVDGVTCDDIMRNQQKSDRSGCEIHSVFVEDFFHSDIAESSLEGEAAVGSTVRERVLNSVDLLVFFAGNYEVVENFGLIDVAMDGCTDSPIKPDWCSPNVLNV